ncbi:MAG: hypothetical protein KIT56_05440 [Gammaproteobacteria bacterium]|nr:hypothetical protein [Gammaproteobacteria bacterium]MCW5583318.1 hypothetical protein [Gammaproteobacteria bacterium]
MWLQRYTDYLLRQRWQAIALTFFITFVPLIGTIGILIAALITLVKGAAEGAIFTVAASLPFVLSFYVSGTHGTTAPLVVWAAVGVAVLSNILTWVFAVMLRRQTSWSTILQVAALLGVLVVSVIHLIYPDVADWWGSMLQSYYDKAAVTNGVVEASAVTMPSEAQVESIGLTKQYATGLMVAVVLFNALAQLIVARWWQGWVFSRGILRKELYGIRLSQLAGVSFLVGLIFWYWGNSVVLDIMPILYLLFAGAGLSLIHYLFGLMRSPTAWFWLFLLYVTLAVALPVSVILVALIAWVDIWFDVRKRIQKG